MTDALSTKWFSSPYTAKDKHRMMAALYPFVCLESDTGHERGLRSALATMLACLIDCRDQLPDPSVKHQDDRTIADLLAPMSVIQAQDFLVMALILCFFNRENYQSRLQLLISNWTDKFIVVDSLLDALRAIDDGDIETIKDDKYLGEGFHNKISRQNGLSDLGASEYEQQMSMMKEGVRIGSLEEKYKFLNDETKDTLGGSFCRMMRESGLNLPGEPYGFAEFFLWHDLTHVLSRNKTDFVGELAVNAFTAASSHRAKFEILLWGLLQWNLGFSLAVIATPCADELARPGALKNYCNALLCGSHATLDVLNWPLQQLLCDLKLPLDRVRASYNIKLNDRSSEL